MNKKTLVVTNLLTLACLILVWIGGCVHDKQEPKHRDGQKEETCSTVPCPATCFPFDTAAPFCALDKKLALSLIDNYRKRQWTASRNYLAVGDASFEDFRAVWFSLARMKQFIYQIEKNACKTCMKDNKALGIRLYYGTYPDSEDQIWVNNNLEGVFNSTYPAGRHTVMMVPTYYHDGINEDFDPTKMQKKGCTPLSMSQLFNPSIDSTPNFFAWVPGVDCPDENPMDMNHGQHDPPAYDGRFNPPYNADGVNTTNIQCNGHGLMNRADLVSPPCQ